MSMSAAEYHREYRARQAAYRRLTGRPRPTFGRRSRIWAVLAPGLAVAAELGHRMGEPVRDVTQYSAIAQCERCPHYVVVDTEESPTAYGGATFRPCSLSRMSVASRSTGVAS